MSCVICKWSPGETRKGDVGIGGSGQIAVFHITLGSKQATHAQVFTLNAHIHCMVDLIRYTVCVVLRCALSSGIHQTSHV